jgi:hypothetical protein
MRTSSICRAAAESNLLLGGSANHSQPATTFREPRFGAGRCGRKTIVGHSLSAVARQA